MTLRRRSHCRATDAGRSTMRHRRKRDRVQRESLSMAVLLQVRRVDAPATAQIAMTRYPNDIAQSVFHLIPAVVFDGWVFA